MGQGGGGRLEYIASMLAELKTLAAAERQDMLVYMIDMAQAEAAAALLSHRKSKLGEATEKFTFPPLKS